MLVFVVVVLGVMSLTICNEGGNIAAAVVVRALREKLPPPAGLLLIYPALFLGEVASLSRLLFINDPILTFTTCNMCNNAYLPPELRPAAYVRSFIHLHRADRLDAV